MTASLGTRTGACFCTFHDGTPTVEHRDLWHEVGRKRIMVVRDEEREFPLEFRIVKIVLRNVLGESLVDVADMAVPDADVLLHFDFLQHLLCLL